jgi:hypothetical protein
MSFEDLVKQPPTTADVKKFMLQLQPKAELDGESDVCCCCLPRAMICCLPRCFCPCVCARPEPVSTVKNRDVVEASNQIQLDRPSFLGEERAVRYVSNLFKSSDANECRLEYMSAGMVLLSVGTVTEKLEALFQSFAHAVGGIFNREALEKTVRSLLKTVIDIAQRIADFMTGAAVPGGKAVQLMLNALNGTVGSYFVKNRVGKMLSSDLDKDGAINFDEFRRVAMTRNSVIRKSMAWVETKSAIIRGERPQDQTGPLKLDGVDVWARMIDMNVDADQCLEYWSTKDQIGDRSNRLGIISLSEPCAIDDGPSEDDNVFTIVDSNKKRWTVECSDRDSFFEWYDAVDDRCDAKLEANDLQLDPDNDPIPTCPLLPMLR